MTRDGEVSALLVRGLRGGNGGDLPVSSVERMERMTGLLVPGYLANVPIGPEVTVKAAIEKGAEDVNRLFDDQDTFVAPDKSDPAATYLSRADAMDIPDCIWEQLPVPLFRHILIAQARLAPKIGSIHRVATYLEEEERHVTRGRVLAINKWCWRARSFIVVGDNGEEVVPEPQVQVGDWIAFSRLSSVAKAVVHPRTGAKLMLRLLPDDIVNCKVSETSDPLW